MIIHADEVVEVAAAPLPVVNGTQVTVANARNVGGKRV
jgi:hypothetical protein